MSNTTTSKSDERPVVLLVEDEAPMRKFVHLALEAHGYRVVDAATGAEGLLQAAASSPDLVLLDLGLPDMDGLDVTRRLREWTATPVIVISARGLEQQKVDALDAGADDYLTKPFHFGELLARVRALTRRQALPLLPDRLTSGRLSLNTRSREASVEGKPIDLTTREYALLEYLFRKAGAVVSREEIAEHVWDNRYDPESNVIDVYIQRLRRKIDRGTPSLIRTRRGEGYQLAAQAPDPE
jgi:DNA-binding response OmpR family regulator